MRTITGFILCIFILFSSCDLLFKDDELLLSRQPYIGNELRIDGYYYKYSDNDGTIVKFLYRNGIILSAYYISTTDLNEVEQEMITQYHLLQKEKSRWGVFLINGNTIQYSGWSTSVGGGLPAFKGIGVIDNDSTFRLTKTINSNGKEFEKNDTYHFRQFYPKPDSTNNIVP